MSPGGRELTTISMDKNVNRLAEYLKGAFHWHLDDTTSDVPVARHDADRPRLSIEGGGTEFANTYAAYENLPAHERKRYEGLRVVHSFEAAQRKVNPDPDERGVGCLARRAHPREFPGVAAPRRPLITGDRRHR